MLLFVDQFNEEIPPNIGAALLGEQACNWRGEVVQVYVEGAQPPLTAEQRELLELGECHD